MSSQTFNISYTFKDCINYVYVMIVSSHVDGFGGLVVSILASDTRVRGFKLDFSGVRKILSMHSFGGEVKESVPSPSFAACKRT